MGVRVNGAPPAPVPLPAVVMVFSGIVEELGTVVSLREVSDLLLWNGDRAAGVVLTISCSAELLKSAYDGCSIAVNGTCLTVTSFSDAAFTVGLAPETLRRTDLSDLKAGDSVNLERSLPADGRNSGHFVQGHVDDTGVITEFRPDGDSLWVTIRVPPRLLPYIVPKGYVAVDGTSLTVCDVDKEGSWFNLMLIEYTQKRIVMPRKPVGARVNIEVDVLGKYAERALGHVTDSMMRLTTAMDALTARMAGLERRVASLETGTHATSTTGGMGADAGASTA